MLSVDSKNKLIALGARLKEARLKKNEVQERFAARIGVSVPTLRKMEAGDPSVAIGTWVEALFITARLDDLDSILKAEMNLFERRENLNKNKRLRASKRTVTK